MSTIVITDLHLKFNDKREEKVIEFFNEIVFKYKKLIILGDFFEFWYGFKKVIIADYFNVLIKLKEYSEKGEIVYIEGNHDFNIGKFFTDFLKIRVFEEYYEAIINNKKFLFIHGDTLNIKEDRFYYKLRKFLRSNFTKFLMNNLPPYFILKIAEKFSTTSRKYLFKDFTMEKIIDNFDKRENYDYIISGHFHKNFTYKNVYLLGDWDEEINYMVINENGNIQYKTYNNFEC